MVKPSAFGWNEVWTILVNAAPKVGEDCHKVGVKIFILNQWIAILLTFRATLVTLGYD